MLVAVEVCTYSHAMLTRGLTRLEFYNQPPRLQRNPELRLQSAHPHLRSTQLKKRYPERPTSSAF